MSEPTLSRGRRRRAGPEQWTGSKRPYDLAKEFVIALIVVGLLAVIAALVLSSPDSWTGPAPAPLTDPPYNHAGTGQQIFFLHLQNWAGVRLPVDPAVDFVLAPLSTVTGNPVVTAALAVYRNASASQQQAWASAYDTAISKAPDNDPAKVAPGDYGPVPAMTAALLRLAQSGALNSQLVNQASGFYQDNYTKPLLFLADGGYLGDLASGQHLGGDQWGMMNETGSYPGQAWLWLYTFWYQISPFKTSGNADALVWATMMILSLGLILVSIIPGVRSIPRWMPIYKIIWRDYYRDHPLTDTAGEAQPR